MKQYCDHIRNYLCVLLVSAILFGFAAPALAESPMLLIEKAPKKGMLLMVNADFARLRAKAKSGSKVLATVRKGKHVKFLKDYHGWYKIELSNGALGYMYKTFLVNDHSTIKVGKLYRSNSNNRLVIYKKGKKGAKVLGSIRPTTVVLMLKANGKWGQVRIVKNGKVGYVLTKKLERVY